MRLRRERRPEARSRTIRPWRPSDPPAPERRHRSAAGAMKTRARAALLELPREQAEVVAPCPSTTTSRMARSPRRSGLPLGTVKIAVAARLPSHSRERLEIRHDAQPPPERRHPCWPTPPVSLGEGLSVVVAAHLAFFLPETCRDTAIEAGEADRRQACLDAPGRPRAMSEAAAGARRWARARRGRRRRSGSTAASLLARSTDPGRRSALMSTRKADGDAVGAALAPGACATCRCLRPEGRRRPISGLLPASKAGGLSGLVASTANRGTELTLGAHRLLRRRDRPLRRAATSPRPTPRPYTGRTPPAPTRSAILRSSATDAPARLRQFCLARVVQRSRRDLRARYDKRAARGGALQVAVAVGFPLGADRRGAGAAGILLGKADNSVPARPFARISTAISAISRDCLLGNRSRLSLSTVALTSSTRGARFFRLLAVIVVLGGFGAACLSGDDPPACRRR